MQACALMSLGNIGQAMSGFYLKNSENVHT